jgi:xanthine dehydrogenase accessory factor
MFEEFYDKLEALRRQNELFVTATVIRREAPSSGKIGDKAIIDQYGEITGWIGGGCVRGIALKEAEEAMRSGKARLVQVGKNSLHEQDDIINYKMTCMSEGAVELFLEPVLPPPHLVVIGKTLIASALVHLAKVSGFRVTAVAPNAKPNTFQGVDELITQLNLKEVRTSSRSSLIICTQGENDEEAIEQALHQSACYIGFVASPKKKMAIFEHLVERGVDRAAINTIHSPAGLNIHAKTPEEVAISILAEIIQVQNQLQLTGFSHFVSTNAQTSKSGFYINPVCGVPVDIKNPKHIVEYKNEKIYFCCDGCKTKFDADPEKYATNQSYEPM